MTPARLPAAISARWVRAVPVIALGAALAGPVGAAEPAYPAGYGGGGGPAERADGQRRLDLSIGRSVVVDLPRDAKEVFVANPAIANAVVRSARKIFLIGVANGVTSVFVMDSEGRQIAGLEVVVGRDLNVLRQTLRTTIPTGRIDVKAAGDSILLTGLVGSAGDAQQAVDIAKAFVGQSGGGGGGGGSIGAGGGGGSASGGSSASPAQAGGGSLTGGVINALTISGRDQVMLRVSVVEMARTAVKQLGVNVGSNWNVLDTASNFVNPASNLVGVGTGLLAQTLGTNGLNVAGQVSTGNNTTIGGTLTALERAGLSRTLAEPTLVAISGESANFLAGGEIPVIINTCATSATAGGCTPTVSYKKYGVSLDFTPVVLSEGRISLRVVTEVSEIDRENRDLVTGSPGFRTRRSATTIELPSGGTMVTAGLISSQSVQSISGVPGLINLPVLGALFRSRDFQRRDTELMISVTPFIAKPLEAAQVARPDDGFVDANDPSTLLLGRLNKIYGVAGPGGAMGVSGRFGFITD